MGYESGRLSGKGSGQRYAENAFKIGKCNVNDPLTGCRGGCNDYNTGEKCGNNDRARCKAGEPVKVTITCERGSIKTSSCGKGNGE